MIFAGFSSVDITPNKTYPMAGFDLRKEPNIGVHDRLFAKAVVIENDTSACAFCTLDLLGAPDDLVRDISRLVSARTPISESAVQVSAIHTHAAPSAIFKSSSCFDDDYRRFVIDSAVEAVVRACQSRSEVAAHYAHASVGGVASYRDRSRDASACKMPIDSIWLKSKEEGKRDILISTFACHPTVLNEANKLITRDLVFGCEKSLKAQLSETDFIFVNGACADLSTRYTRCASNFDEVERLGALWAEEIVASLDSVERLSDEIAFSNQVLFVPPANFFTDDQRAEILDYLEEKINSCPDSEQCREYVSCRSVLKRENYGRGRGCDATLAVVKIGNLVLCLLPFEYAQVDAARLKDSIDSKLGVTSIVCCYSNGYEGYLPSGRPLDRDSGYEDVASPFRHDAKELVADAVEKLVCLVK